MLIFFASWIQLLRCCASLPVDNFICPKLLDYVLYASVIGLKRFVLHECLHFKVVLGEFDCSASRASGSSLAVELVKP